MHEQAQNATLAHFAAGRLSQLEIVTVTVQISILIFPPLVETEISQNERKC